MKDDFSQMMTPFDLSISSRSLQITKILIPFLPPKSQRMMAIYVKFMEFQNTLSFFSGIKKSNNELMDEIKNMLPKNTLETYENMMNIMSMVDMLQEMDMDFDPMSMMANMFNNEEKEGESDDGLVE